VKRPPAFTQVWWQQWGLTAMLVLLTLSLFVALPLEALGVISSTVVGIAMTFLFVAGVVAMAGRGLVTGVVAVAALASLVVRWLSLTSPSRDLEVLDIVLAMVALALLTAVLLRHVFREGPITADRIRGAVAVYLLIGLLWCLAYQLLDYIVPGSFHLVESGVLIRGRISHRLAYFSFVTLTTVGYGDITPVHPIARALATAEALVGQLYPAILIGRLVSLQISARPGGGSK
jgi:Ion channel